MPRVGYEGNKVRAGPEGVLIIKSRQPTLGKVTPTLLLKNLGTFCRTQNTMSTDLQQTDTV